MNEILKVSNLSYKYLDGNRERIIFNNVNISFDIGKFYLILGDSGSGKTTFLSIIAGLDNRYDGSILYKDKNIKDIGLINYRKSAISMIFQNFNLLPHLNAVENIMIAMDISSNVNSIDEKTIIECLNEYGISQDKAKRKVSSLSGGEMQRVAIVRSVLTNNKIIIADEPTGNLDRDTSISVVEEFVKLAHIKNCCVIMVTHNLELIKYADVVYKIKECNILEN